MSREYKTDEINNFINCLYDSGKRGGSNGFNGISLSDEDHLTALLIQATPSDQLPTVNMLDLHNGFPVMIARFIDGSDQNAAVELCNYVKTLYKDLFKDTIDRLFQECAYERELVQQRESKL